MGIQAVRTRRRDLIERQAWRRRQAIQRELRGRYGDLRDAMICVAWIVLVVAAVLVGSARE